MKKIILFIVLCITTGGAFSQYTRMAFEFRDSTLDGKVNHIVANSEGLYLSSCFQDTVVNIWVDLWGGYWYQSTVSDNALYFFDCDTKDTTIYDVNPYENEGVPYPSDPDNTLVFQDEIYFAADSLNETSTYKIDPLTNKPIALFDFEMYKAKLSLTGDSLFFLKYETTQTENPLLYWDGTDTLRLPNQNFKQALNFVPLGDKFIVHAILLDEDGNIAGETDGETFTEYGRELLLYDPEVGASLLSNTTADAKNGTFDYMTRSGNKVYFRKQGASSDVYSIWETDGTVEGTGESSTIMAGIDGNIQISNLYDWDGQLVFTAPTSANKSKNKLFAYNTSTDELMLLMELKNANNSLLSFVTSGYTPFQGELYFAGRDVEGNENVLYKTDGSLAGTMQVDSSLIRVRNLTAFGDKLYMSAEDPSGSLLANGNRATTGVELFVYDPTVSISNIATLKSLQMDGEDYADFDKNTANYEVLLDAEVSTIPTLSYTLTDAKASVKESLATTIPGQSTITVIAENQVDSTVYKLNYRYASTIATLDSICTFFEDEDTVLLEGFRVDSFYYEVILSDDYLTPPAVLYYLTDTSATVTLEQEATTIPGTAKITLLAEDGVTENTYQVLFRYLSENALLSEISVGGSAIADFDAAQESYEVVLASEVLETPLIGAVAQDENAEITIVPKGTLPDTVSITVVAENGINNKTYTLYIRNASTDATLSDILVDGVSLESFDAAVFSYTIDLPENTTVLPSVEGILSDAKASLSYSSDGTVPGTVEIAVVAEETSSTETYTLNFNLLSRIALDLKEQIKVYPTVSAGKVYLETAHMDVQIELYNIAGAQKYAESVLQGKHTLVLPSKGVYFLKVFAGKDLATYKLICQ